MITVASSELSSDSRLPTIPNSKSSTTLEALTGADILITPLTIPCKTEKLIRLHIKAGALLVQRKSGSDLVMSIGERVNTALARMRSVGARQWQCILLSTGYYAPKFEFDKENSIWKKDSLWVGTLKADAKKGKPYIWWKNVPRSYQALQTSLRHFTYRGGVYIPLSCDDEIPGWCKRTEEELIAFHKGEMSVIKQIWPSAKTYPPDPPRPNDPLQEPVLVTDGRVILAQFKGVGPTIANRVWDAVREWKKAFYAAGDHGEWEPDVYTALTMLMEDTSTWNPPVKIHGWGKKKMNTLKAQFGLAPGISLGLEIIDRDEYTKWMNELYGDINCPY